MKRFFPLLLLTLLLTRFSHAQLSDARPAGAYKIIPGADRLDQYLPFLKEKSVGVFANQTSMVGSSHLVDVLTKMGIKVKVIFGPEHGFRGTADAGEKVGNYTDEKTGIPVVSLYGAKRRPSEEDLKDIDIMLFDIQDVGVRFYTFISSMEEYIAAAKTYDKPLIILDRPNPNGHYVDGPVLDLKYRSFVGMQPVPIVYGMTLGEYATMLLSEGWLDRKNEKEGNNAAPPSAALAAVEAAENPQGQPDDLKKGLILIDNADYVKPGFSMRIIRCENYDHRSFYTLPVKPSPNLPDIQSVYLYPSTCFFEGTVFSEGRGTSRPFQVFGHPLLSKKLYAFTPQPNEGAKSSKHYGVTCYGWDLGGTPEKVRGLVNNQVQVKWLIEAYQAFPKKDSFFLQPKSGNMEQSSITRLAGTNDLWQQVRNGVPEEKIRASWEPALSEFKKLRKKYLLYKDFE